jgi:hypothetical protein
MLNWWPSRARVAGEGVGDRDGSEILVAHVGSCMRISIAQHAARRVK